MIDPSNKRIVFKSSKIVYSDGSVESTTFTYKVPNPYLRKKKVCIRCGRNSHEESTCYARTHLRGHDISQEIQEDYEFIGTEEDHIRRGVYVLSLNDGKYHVGQSEDIDTTVDVFMSGGGSEWSNHHGVVCEVSPLTTYCSSMDEWERKETIERAMTFGMANVRGYKWGGLCMDPREFHEFESCVCESKNLCKNCGKPHDITVCNSSSTSMWMRL